MTARVRPGSRREVGFATWLLATAGGLVAGTRAPNLFLVLGKHRKLFRSWLHFAGRLMPGGTLPRRETELAILRVAHLRGCRYEFDHHVRLGRRAGVRDEDVDRVIAGPDESGWTDRERVVLRTVDRLQAERDLDDTAWSALRAHHSERAVIELCLLVGHYDMLATTINVLRVPADEPRRG